MLLVPVLLKYFPIVAGYIGLHVSSGSIRHLQSILVADLVQLVKYYILKWAVLSKEKESYIRVSSVIVALQVYMYCKVYFIH